MKYSLFMKYVNLYGSDIKGWPEDIRKDALEAYNGSSELRKLVEEELRFEESLDMLPLEEPGGGLAGRIIRAASVRPGTEEMDEEVTDSGPFLSQLFLRLLAPQPVMALVLTLVVGFVVGYSNPSVPDVSADDDIVAFLYNGEDML